MTNLSKKLLLLVIAFFAVTSCKSNGGNASYKIDYMYFPANGEEKDVAVIVIGGSDGGIPTHNSQLTKGCPVMRLAYFGTPNTPASLELIELEYLNAAIEEFKTLDNVSEKKIVVMGGSKGGELALLWASINPEINGVIGIVPSSVAFQGIGMAFTSSWSFDGEPVPFVPYVPFDYNSIVNYEYVEVYNDSLDQDMDMEDAIIKAENINGPILLLSGIEDTMWPATRMSNDVIKRLDEKGFKYDYEHIAYEDAGHSLTESWLMGGSVEGNKKAREDSEIKIMDFIDKLDNM